jgi:hypothetical protein
MKAVKLWVFTQAELLLHTAITELYITLPFERVSIRKVDIFS